MAEKVNLKDDITVCIGHVVGELIPLHGMRPEQEHILSYVKGRNTILTPSSHDIDAVLQGEMPPSAEIVGAFNEGGVARSLRYFADRDVDVRVNPALTISKGRLYGWASEARDRENRALELERQLNGGVYETTWKGNYLHCRKIVKKA